MLCEGQHHKKDLPNHQLQDMLRNQTEADESYNIIIEVRKSFIQLLILTNYSLDF